MSYRQHDPMPSDDLPNVTTFEGDHGETLIPLPVLTCCHEDMLNSHTRRADLDRLVDNPGFILQFLMQFRTAGVNFTRLHHLVYYGEYVFETQRIAMKVYGHVEHIFEPAANHPSMALAWLFSYSPDQVGVREAGLPWDFELPSNPALRGYSWRDPALEDVICSQGYYREIFKAHGALRILPPCRAKAVVVTTTMVLERLFPVFEYRNLFPGFDRTRQYSFELLGWQILWHLIHNQLEVPNHHSVVSTDNSDWDTGIYPLAISFADVFGTLNGFNYFELELLSRLLYDDRFHPVDRLRGTGLRVVEDVSEPVQAPVRAPILSESEQKHQFDLLYECLYLRPRQHHSSESTTQSQQIVPPTSPASQWTDLSSTTPEGGLGRYGNRTQTTNVNDSNGQETQLELAPLTEANLSTVPSNDSSLQPVGLDGYDPVICKWLKQVHDVYR